ncbi:MAG: sugar transferase [Liquorilactobacillus nagelii]|uniref:sugar transferase n=1 Tax=Liquorilactobacillus nagelii TaxID=82688 RepID=UPI0039EC699B
MRNYVVGMYDKTQNEAGPKAKRDIEKFLGELGFQTINFYFQGARKAELISYKQSWWDIPRRLKGLGADNLFFQYPAFNQRTNEAILTSAKQNAAKVYLIIHDVESLREFSNDSTFINWEINFFNQSDGLVVHNTKMQQWLKQNGVQVPMVDLQIFDYDNPQPLIKQVQYQGSLCYAGNLAKAEFLQELNLKHQLHLFGPNPSVSLKDAANYHGSFSPEELPAHLQGNFGLVWDGNQVEQTVGKFGAYLKYNNPHKTSLYLSSGLPVIIAKDAALADFITSQGLGIAVTSLKELDRELLKINAQEYEQMRQRVQRIAKKTRSGQYIKAAVKQLID